MKALLKIFKFPLLIVFFAILLLPSFNSAVGLWEFERRDENRSFRDSVEFDIHHLDVFPGEFETFYNDNFAFRTPLLNVYHYIKFHYYKVSPNPEKTIIGRDGLYFNGGKEVKIFEGRLNFSDEDLEKFETEWSQRKTYLDSMDIKFYWMICPFKHHIYPEYLPLNVPRFNDIKRVDQLKETLADSFPGLIIDPTEKLLAAKDSMMLYYELDNHWNLRAGYIASKLLLAEIKKDFPGADIPEIENYDWQKSEARTGFHYHVLGMEDLFEVVENPSIKNEKAPEVAKYGFPPLEGFAYPQLFEKRFVNPNDSTGLRILFIRDSFGNQLMPFIKEPFRETVLIFDAWQYKLNADIIEVMKPDIVVFLGLETHLDAVIKDWP